MYKLKKKFSKLQLVSVGAVITSKTDSIYIGKLIERQPDIEKYFDKLKKSNDGKTETKAPKENTA